MKNLAQKKKQEGFTIIEVLIVLAIAGLIIVIVLIAVPQLQRNQRNSARQAIANRVVTEVNNYAGNNNGRIPANAADLASLRTRYLGCGGTPEVCTVDISDPRSGNPMALTIVASPGAGVPTGAEGTLNYATRVTCNGEALVTSGASARNFALWTQLEGGAIYCVDNG